MSAEQSASYATAKAAVEAQATSWTFRPYRVGGIPRRTHSCINVPIRKSDIYESRHTPFPEQVRPFSATLSERGGFSYGFPGETAYVRIDEDGLARATVLGEPERVVALASSDIDALLEMVRTTDFLSLRNRYPVDDTVLDGGWRSLEIRVGAHVKEVTFLSDGGLASDAPQGLSDLVAKLEEISLSPEQQTRSEALRKKRARAAACLPKPP